MNWNRRFHNVDYDCTGLIGVEKLQRALSNGTMRPFNPELCRQLIVLFDANKNGFIDLEEFEPLWHYINEWKREFRGFDVEKLGRVDVVQLENALSQYGYRLTPRFLHIAIVQFDRSKSGRLYFDDFLHFCVVLQRLTAPFRQVDTDRDGRIQINFEEFLIMAFAANA